MTLLLEALLCSGLIFMSGLFSGSETGVYRLSRIRVDAEAQDRRTSARVIKWLLGNETALLITLLIGNNLMLEFLAHQSDGWVHGFEAVPPWGRELVSTLLIAPVLFFFGELLPKDLFRHRPHRLIAIVAPILIIARVLFLPLTLPLQWLSALIGRLFGLKGEQLSAAFGREQVLDFVREGAQAGTVPVPVASLARNVLALRDTPVGEVMIVWRAAERVVLSPGDQGLDDGPEARQHVLTSDFTRLPVTEQAAKGERVLGYVHQIDLMGPDHGGAVLKHLREIPSVPVDLPVDRALTRLRLSGQRIALVGTVDAPLGLVTLTDLARAVTGALPD